MCAMRRIEKWDTMDHGDVMMYVLEMSKKVVQVLDVWTKLWGLGLHKHRGHDWTV
jgi:hypothetical protein